MLSADDHPGVFTFLVGMIVLVMSGVGLSLMVDRHFKFSGGVGQIRREIALNASEIHELSDRGILQSQALAAQGSKLRVTSQTHQKVLGQVETLRQRQAGLEKTLVQTRDSITALEGDFSRYRSDYRRQTWAGAVGEPLGDLTLRGGREFRQAVITRVTDVGLEIRHEHGIARIQAPDLDSKIQDRFQWSDEERRNRLKEERENHLGGPIEDTVVADAGGPLTEAASEPVVQQVPRNQTAAATVDPERLENLRHKVSAWKMKVGQIQSERMEASSRASYGKQTSVPGSLETWGARSARLGRDLLRAQAGLAAAKANLSAVSPNDPMLRHLQPE